MSPHSSSDTDPFLRFRSLFEQAAARAPFDHTAMTLATSDADGQPSARVVLLNGLDERGFVFYTNYGSRKGRTIAANPKGCLNFYWPWIEEQVRIEGVLEKIAPEESDAYFVSRERGKQVGAWASLQSEPLDSRERLEARVAEIDRQYAGRDVPRPPHWGGYRLTPSLFEFWRNGEHRLHDRFQYTRVDDGWLMTRLYP
jgi:pyridoxamine 5'-phosphate oxidase